MHADEWAEAQRVVEESILLSQNEEEDIAEFERVTAENERLRNRFEESVMLFLSPPLLNMLQPENLIAVDDGTHSIFAGTSLLDQIDQLQVALEHERDRAKMWKRLAKATYAFARATDWRLLERCGYRPTSKMVTEDLRLEIREHDWWIREGYPGLAEANKRQGFTDER
jgi:hypothetical protein